MVPVLFRGFLTESPVSAAPNDFRMTPLSVVVAEIQNLEDKNSTFCISVTTADTDLNRVLKIGPRCDLINEKQPCPTDMMRQEIQIGQRKEYCICTETLKIRHLLVILAIF